MSNGKQSKQYLRRLNRVSVYFSRVCPNRCTLRK